MACYRATVDATADGQRIDAFIRRFLPEISAVRMREAFSHRDVKLNGQRVRQDTRVRTGQLVQVYCMETDAAQPDVVYEDEDVLLVNKRAGISVEPDARGGVCLTELCRRYVAAQDPNAPVPVPCHRLDHQTCGLILFARHAFAAEVLLKAFRERSLDKRYQCLVKGQMKPPSATCHAWLIKDAEAARVRILDHPAGAALPIATAYETLESGAVSRLRVHLLTGRTHQIRAHLAALGHPLLGDDVYGDRAFNRAMHAQGKLMLCATELTLETGGALPKLDGRHFCISCPF